MWVSFQNLCTEHRAGGIQGQELPSPSCLGVIKPFFLRVVQEIKRERELCMEPTPQLVKTHEEPKTSVQTVSPTPSSTILSRVASRVASRVPSVKEPEPQVQKGRLM